MATSSSRDVPEEAEEVRCEWTDQERPEEFADEEGGGNLVGADHLENSGDAVNRAREEAKEEIKTLKKDIEDLWRRLKEKLCMEIKGDELFRMKKLSESYLEGRDLTDIGMTSDLLQELEKNEVVGSFETKILSDILEGIERTDLAFQVVQYREQWTSKFWLESSHSIQQQESRSLLSLLELESSLGLILRFNAKYIVPNDVQNFYRRLAKLSESTSTHKRIYRGRVMLVGAYGAGKTSTKRSLFNEPYVEQHLSTDGAGIYDIDITEWIIKGLNTEYQGQKSIDETKKILGDVLATEMVKGESASARETFDIVPEKVVDVIEALKLKGEKMKDVETRLTQHGKKTDLDKPDVYFSLWDFAGQSVYYITHQVFLGNRVIFVLVTDLTKSLDDTMSTDVEDRWTVKDFLSFWMNSIHTHALPGSNIQLKPPDGNNSETPAPPVILLGTKKDLLQKSNIPPDACAQDEDVEKGAVERLTEIVDYLGRNATQAVNAHRVGMMAIDNKSRTSEGMVPDSDVEKLRKMIQSYAMEYFCLGEVPVKWIRLELSLRTMQHKTIKLEEVEKIGKKLEMTENEILEALAFYHSVGEILHFTTVPELKDTVILDVRWLVDLFTILINQSMTYKQQLGDVDWRMRSLIAELHKEGRLHDALLDYLLKRHDRFQDKAILIALSEMYDILFSMPETDRDKPVYYLPSLLQKDAAGKNGIVCPADSKSCDPVYFHFQGNFLPEGIFYRLVVRCLKQWPNPDMVLRKHKARIFIENDDFHITLCKKGSDIELKALIMSESKYSTEFQPVLLSNVRSVVENELKKLMETYTPNLKYQVCIKCRCPNHHPGELLRGAEDTDDRCVAIKVEKGKAKAICRRSNKLLLHPDLKFWYCAENIPEVQAPVDLPEARRDQKTTLSALRKYFLHLSKNLGKEDEKMLLHLLKGDKIQKREAENMSSAMDILCFLEDAGYISIDKTTLLVELLESLDRKSLVDDMKKFLG